VSRGEDVLPYLLIAPACLLLVSLVAYPVVVALFMSLTQKRIGMPGEFVGLRNFISLFQDEIFLQALWNSAIYVVSAVGLKTILGMTLALLLYRITWGASTFQALLLLPWVVPSSLSVLAWRWMYDPTLSVINWTLGALGLGGMVPWLSTPFWARASIILVNVWRGLPFFGVSFLAGLVAIPRELYEAAEADGAGPLASFRYITLPLLRPILGVVVLYSTVMTISDFEIVYLLTRGGPRNSTHLLSTLAYQVGLVGGEVGRGAAILLFIFPVMALTAHFLLRAIRAGEEST
jgi:multiple sugar transport system permease protein